MGSNGYISASGATAKLRDLDVVSNNLANVGTPGFKRGESVFRATLEASLRDAQGRKIGGGTESAFVKTDLVGSNFSMGSAEHTGSPLHAMIQGPGFFEIETPYGPRYTRAGNFIINRDGNLALPSGAPVVGESGPISIPDGLASVDTSGAILDGTGNIIGRLQVQTFEDLQGLEHEGNSLFRVSEGLEATAVENPEFIPKSIEGSNVQSARELSTLIMLQRAFETNLQAMKVDDESTQRLIEGIR